MEFDFMPLDDAAKVEAAITERTKLIWIETPTNPLLKIVDVVAIARMVSQPLM